MRQAIIWLNLTGSFIVFALTIQLFDVVVMFLLFGIIPGRIEPLSADQMLAIYGAAAAVVCLYSLRSTLQYVVRWSPQRQSRGNAS